MTSYTKTMKNQPAAQKFQVEIVVNPRDSNCNKFRLLSTQKIAISPQQRRKRLDKLNCMEWNSKLTIIWVLASTARRALKLKQNLKSNLIQKHRELAQAYSQTSRGLHLKPMIDLHLIRSRKSKRGIKRISRIWSTTSMISKLVFKYPVRLRTLLEETRCSQNHPTKVKVLTTNSSTMDRAEKEDKLVTHVLNPHQQEWIRRKKKVCRKINAWCNSWVDGWQRRLRKRFQNLNREKKAPKLRIDYRGDQAQSSVFKATR